MPISYKLTNEEKTIIELIKNIKAFYLQKDDKNNIVLSKFTEWPHLLAIARDYPVPHSYVLKETEEIMGFEQARKIKKDEFIEFRDGCKEDEYLLFQFHQKGGINFSLGYIKSNCNDDNCAVRWFKNKNATDHMVDKKGKKGILHKKDEFDTLITISGDNIYLHRRKYKDSNKYKSEQTVVLSNAKEISQEPNTDTFENVGGSCCPPEF